MIPQDKAIELVGKFKDFVAIDYRHDEEPIFGLQKECALICVDEIIPLLDSYKEEQYWLQVKTEIEKL